MMAADTGDAFDRAADKEFFHRLKANRQRRRGSLVWARSQFHGKINSLLFLLAAFAAHWYLVQRVTNWVIAHGVLIVLAFLGLVSAWGDQRVAEAELMERRASSAD